MPYSIVWMGNVSIRCHWSVILLLRISPCKLYDRRLTDQQIDIGQSSPPYLFCCADSYRPQDYSQMCFKTMAVIECWPDCPTICRHSIGRTLWTASETTYANSYWVISSLKTRLLSDVFQNNGSDWEAKYYFFISLKIGQVNRPCPFII